MEWVITALAVIILGIAALAAAGRLGSMPEADDDVYAPPLPTGEITSDDLRGMRFGVALRGYDMRQVDTLLRRLADQLDGAATPLQGAASAGAETREPREPDTPVEASGIMEPATDEEK